MITNVDYLKVVEDKTLVREASSGAILASDLTAKQEHLAKVKKITSEKEQLQKMEARLTNLEQSVLTTNELLIKLLNKIESTPISESL